MGYVEPLNEDLANCDFSNQFVNKVVGTSIPNEYIGAVEKAFYDCV